MLDNEPRDNSGEQGGEGAGASTPPETAASTTPARRTRAPRRKAAAPPPEAPADEPGQAIEAANAQDAVASPSDPVAAIHESPVTSSEAAAASPEAAASSEAAAEVPATPVKKATRARKKAAPAAAPAPEAEEGTEVAPPVKATRTRRKKAAAPAAAVEEPAAETLAPASEAPAAETPVEPVRVEALVEGEEPTVSDETTEEEATAEGTPIIGVIPLDADFVEEEKPAPRRGRRAAALPPAVLFMPPEATETAPAPARRSRRGAAAVPPVTAETPETPALSEVEAEVAELPVATEEPAETTRRSRRRRRGAAEEPAEAEATDTEVTAPPAEEAVDEADESADDVEDGVDDENDDDDDSASGRRRRRRGRRGRGRGKGPAEDGEQDEGEDGAEASADEESEDEDESEDGEGVTRRRRRRRRKGSGSDAETGGIEDGVHTVVRVREPRRTDEVQGVSGSTRLEAKRQRRRDGREQRRTRPPILSESEFLARREAVDRVMVVRQKPDRTQIAVLEDGILVEHYVSRSTSGTMVGNVYLGKVQNVLPSMEAAFVDIGRGRNAVLYAGEVNWDATGLEGRARSIEQALRSGDSVLVQVTKDPIGHKGARLSSHIALSGRHLVYVPNGNASGISRKLPDNERKRLRDVLKKLVPDGAGVIVRTAAEGASEDDLARDVKRLQAQWEEIQRKSAEGHAPVALSEEPDLVIRVVRDLFNEDFRELVVQGDSAYGELENYLNSVSPDLLERMHRYTGTGDVFADQRIDEQILKGLDRKVFLPSGGHLVFDRTEAMTVVDVNTGKYTGAGGNLEETVTRNNLEAAEEIVRQLRLRDLGGIVVIDFIDMVLESNRELVLRRLTECLGRDRTKHQVTEITSLGLVQMTRKRIGSGLLEAFSETCDHCKGRGVLIHTEPVPEKRQNGGAANQVKAVAAAARTEQAPAQQQQPAAGKSRRRRGGGGGGETAVAEPAVVEAEVETPAEVVAEASAPVRHDGDDPAAETAGLPPVAGSGIVTAGRSALTKADPEDDYDISGYDLSRYEAAAPAASPAADAEPMRLTGADDPDAADDDDDEDDDEPVGAGAGGRRRSRRGGTRRRTRP
ncbi:Rne/Rng family ribonuclease [Actinoplanes sp. LDG1-06]|uniref:Rne/Rng family ribonuclease n=1 Tax=Paractinoplanes ovalisporus TaxID=2810368 RepID=A0ABS2AP92_9ACTN|nr:Rne/Rng family ribonuclease [Actinoplanes ovalisporus]MBM2621677.1 Rne/Rng family ribonuclease [Actinoplanes ovalisporus]